VVDAAKVIQARGLALCMINSRGSFGRLTGEGRIFVDQGKGTGIISEYRRAPEQFVQNVNISGGAGNNYAVGSDLADVRQSATNSQDFGSAFKVLDDIEQRVASDATLGREDRQDVLSDVDSVRRQLKKREPNRNVLASLLDSLGQITLIGVQVMTLIKMING
jgi:hypothetical protein